MRRRRVGILAAGVLLLAAAVYAYVRSGPATLVLTGVVTTDDVVVSPQVAGRLAKLEVREGDVVERGRLLAVMAPEELRADAAYYDQSAAVAAAQVDESLAALRFQEKQAAEQVRQAESALASAQAQVDAAAAELEQARLTQERSEALSREGVVSSQELDAARTAAASAAARAQALQKQVGAAQAGLALARSNAEQVAVKRSQLESDRHRSRAAAAQRDKAEVRLGYAELRAPIGGVVDVRAARVGEFVAAGEPVVTLIDPDDLWVRIDVEESYIDAVRLGDEMTVRLPSGAERTGTVIFRGVDAGFATQRDVSRTKRDIKTFEVRLRVDNADRRLAVGMTAYALLGLP